MTRPPASALITEQRVTEVLRIRLQGAELHDVRAYVASKQADPSSPWFLPDGGPPLCDRQLRRLMRKADRIVRKTTERKRSRLISWHLAKLNHLYATAIQAAEYATALRCLQEQAELLDLYPAKMPPLEIVLRHMELQAPEAAAVVRSLIYGTLPATDKTDTD